MDPRIDLAEAVVSVLPWQIWNQSRQAAAYEQPSWRSFAGKSVLEAEAREREGWALDPPGTV